MLQSKSIGANVTLRLDFVHGTRNKTYIISGTAAAAVVPSPWSPSSFPTTTADRTTVAQIPKSKSVKPDPSHGSWPVFF